MTYNKGEYLKLKKLFEMRKILFAVFSVIAMCLYSCVNKTTSVENCTDSTCVDSIAKTDSVCIADSTETDSVPAVTNDTVTE